MFIGHVTSVPVYMYDVFDLLLVGFRCVFEVFVLEVLSNLHYTWHTIYIILDWYLYRFVWVAFGFHRYMQKRYLVEDI